LSCLPKAQWSRISSHQCFYSPLLGPSGYPTDLVTASLVPARDEPKGINPVTLLALRLLQDSVDARNKARSSSTSHPRTRIERYQRKEHSASSWSLPTGHSAHISRSFLSQPASYGSCTVQRASCTYRTRTAGAAYTGQGRQSGENLHTTPPVNNPPSSGESTAISKCSKLLPCSGVAFHHYSTPSQPDYSCAVRSRSPLHSCAHCPREDKGGCTCQTHPL